MYLNQLTIIGFTGSEADVHYTTSGKMVVTTLSSYNGIVEERRRGMAEPHGVVSCRPVRLATGRVRPDSGEGLARDGAGLSVDTRIQEGWSVAPRFRASRQQHQQVGPDRALRTR